MYYSKLYCAMAYHCILYAFGVVDMLHCSTAAKIIMVMMAISAIHANATRQQSEQANLECSPPRFI